MNKKENNYSVANKLYWINLGSWVLIFIYTFWRNYYTNMCGDPCDKCIKKYLLGTPSEQCYSNLFRFYKNNFGVIDTVFMYLFYLILISSVVVLIILIKRKELKKIAVGIIAILILLFGLFILTR